MLSLIHPATFLVSGATGSGKTILVFRLIDAVLDGELFEPPIKRIWYCYSAVSYTHLTLPTNREV